MVMAIEFGEKLSWKVRQKNKLEKLRRYEVFVGVKAICGEQWVATKQGLQAARSVRRLPVEDRWNENNKDLVKHVWCEKSGEDFAADGDLPETPEGTAAIGASVVRLVDLPRVIVSAKETAPRQFRVKKRDVEAHCRTKESPGCRIR